MHNNYIDKLEFNKILDVLSGYCVTNIGKCQAKNLYPQSKKDVVKHLLKETTEATSLIYKKHTPPFQEIVDFKYIEKMLKTGSSLNAKNLLEVARNFKSSG